MIKLDYLIRVICLSILEGLLILRVSSTEHGTNQSIADELGVTTYAGRIKRHQTLEKLILEGRVKAKKTEEGQKDLRKMWRTGWGQVSGEWDEQQKIG